ASKTSEMLREITKYSDLSHKRCALVINHSFDTRDIKRTVSSHSSIYKGLSEKVDALSATTLQGVDVSNYTIIGVDESQFFVDLVEVVKEWLRQGKHIICAGLDSDSNMNKFGYLSDLLHMADKFIKMNAVCQLCMNETLEKGEVITPCNTVPAPFTKKISKDGQLIDIGGEDKYIAVCRKHHAC
ncbi:MAG: hypothetical protein ACMG6E_03090, partial [Candidatus Roizmanbacteria bacterium]